jgi:hypothetical protein
MLEPPSSLGRPGSSVAVACFPSDNLHALLGAGWKNQVSAEQELDHDKHISHTSTDYGLCIHPACRPPDVHMGTGLEADNQWLHGRTRVPH